MWCVVDTASRIIYCNKNYNNILCNLVGIEPHNNDLFIGKTHEDIIKNKLLFKDNFFVSDRMVIESKTMVSLLYCLQKSNLEWIVLQADKNPILNVDGEVEAIMFHITDQTAARSLDLALAISKEVKIDKTSDRAASVLININNMKKTVELKTKESECLFYLTRGFSYKEIARKQKVSYRTIVDQVYRLKNKFDASTTSDLITKSIASGYINALPSDLFQRPMLIIF